MLLAVVMGPTAMQKNHSGDEEEQRSLLVHRRVSVRQRIQRIVRQMLG